MVSVKRDLPYLITIILLIVLFIGLVIFYIFNKDKKIINIPKAKQDSEYNWILQDSYKEVEKNDEYKDLVKDEYVTDQLVEISKNTALEFKDSEKMYYTLISYDTYLIMNLSLSNKHNIDVILISDNDKAYKYNIRTIGSDITKIINYKNINKGRYRLFIQDNDDKYDTMQYIVVN